MSQVMLNDNLKRLIQRLVLGLIVVICFLFAVNMALAGPELHNKESNPDIRTPITLVPDLQQR